MARGERGPRCAYCGGRENLTVDHVVPISRWRECRVRRRVLDNNSNKVPCCLRCNAAKGSMHPKVWLEEHPEYRTRLIAEGKYLSDTVRRLAGIG